MGLSARTIIKVWGIVGKPISIILEAGISKEVDINKLHKMMQVEGLLKMVTQTVNSKLEGMNREYPKIKLVVREMEVGNHRRDKIMQVEGEM